MHTLHPITSTTHSNHVAGRFHAPYTPMSPSGDVTHKKYEHFFIRRNVVAQNNSNRRKSAKEKLNSNSLSKI